MEDLFRKICDETRCGYISNLRFRPWLEMAREMMRAMDCERYPLEQLRDMAEYLYGERVAFQDAGQARAFFRRGR